MTIKRFCTGAVLLILGSVCAAAQQTGGQTSNGSEYIGTCSGKWEMASSSGGGFELILEKGKDTALAGRVSVTGEPAYKAELKTVAFDGKKMTATYDFPPDDNLEVGLASTFDGNTAKGTWTVRGKNGGAEVVSGTWTVTRK